MNRAALQRQAAEALRHDLQPGERFAVGAVVTSDPSRWAMAALLTMAVVLTTVGLLSLLGPLPASPVIAMGAPALGLSIQFLHRPMYVVVTDRRMICIRMSRFRSTARRPALAAPLADVRILSYRSGHYRASIRCEVPGRKAILLHVSRAGRKDFAEVEMALARSGAFAKLDPPYPPRRVAQQRPTETNEQCGR